jgi:hypothetical protein
MHAGWIHIRHACPGRLRDKTCRPKHGANSHRGRSQIPAGKKIFS